MKPSGRIGALMRHTIPLPMSTILTNRRGAVATLILNRPEKLNAFAGTMREELATAIDEAGNDPAVRVVVIRGAGRAFSAGGDVEFMRGLQQRGDLEAFRSLLEAGRRVVLSIRQLAKPVVAAIHGVAAGAGCNLALACDLRIASEPSRLGQSFVRIGLHPDWGGTYFLPRLVGPSRAMEMLLTGRMVEAQEALSIGLVDRVVPAAIHEAEVERFADTLASGPPQAMADIKRAVYGSSNRDLVEQLDLETENQIRAFLSEDGAEGIAAFFDKRPPRFEGR